MARDTFRLPQRQRLARKRISLAENVFSAVLFILLAGILFWLSAQRDKYDPQTRDLAPSQLATRAAGKTLYTPPLQPWLAPGTAPQTVVLDLGIFPESIIDPDWRVVSSPKRFEPDNLFEKINGEAEKFIRQGFQSLHFLVLRAVQDDSELAIELYDQADAKGSIGIFSEHLSEDTMISHAGEAVYFTTSAGAIGRSGRYFFRIAGNRESLKIRQKAEHLVRVFSQLGGPSASVSPEFQVLAAGMNISPERVSFQKKNVFQFDFAQGFWFGTLAPGSSARAFVHRSGSPSAAGELLQKIVREQSADYRLLEKTGVTVVMQHNFLNTYFVINALGSFVFGLENVSDPDRIDPLMQRFTEELQRGQKKISP